MKDVVRFKGHPNIRATHRTTIELTKEGWLTPKGDCIIGVSADKACADLSQNLKESIRRGSRLRITLAVENEKFQFIAYGNPKLELSDPTSIVIRKSEFISPKTMAIRSEASASDIPRRIVELLKKGRNGIMIIEALGTTDDLP